jgi:Family of unknown function (DUF5906)
LSKLLLMFCDEAFWGGSRDSVGTLNALVTESSLMLEHKGVDPIRIRSYLRLMVAGNNDWIIPATMRERRWAIWHMGEVHQQDIPYFRAIDEEMRNGGAEALLQHLIDFDLASVDLRKIPQTDALLAQQIEGLSPLEGWWMTVLCRGVLPTAGVKGKGVTEMHKLHEHYIAHARLHQHSRREIETKLGFFLHGLFQRGDKSLLQEYRPRAAGFDRSSPLRPRCLRFPTLRTCRELFAERMGQQIDWGENWQTQSWRKEGFPHGPLYDEETDEPKGFGFGSNEPVPIR